MKFIVHVGDGKCGSAAIQESLTSAKDHLADKNIRYDGARTGPNRRVDHFCFVSLVNRKTRGNDERVINKALAGIKKLNSRESNEEYTLLSAESFIGLQVDELFTILGKISKKIDEVYVIAYFREPTSMYLSLTQQIIKGGYLYKSPENYLRRIDLFSERWGNDPRITKTFFREFSPKTLKDSSSVKDFENILGMIVNDDTINLPDVRTNTSLSAEQLIALQEYRRFVHPNLNGKHSKDTNAVITFFSGMNETKFIGHKLKLTDQAKATILEKNRNVIEKFNANTKMNFASADKGSASSPTSTEETEAPSVKVVLQDYNPEISDALSKLVLRYFQPKFNLAEARRETQWKKTAKLIGIPAKVLEEGAVKLWKDLPRLIDKSELVHLKSQKPKKKPS